VAESGSVPKATQLLKFLSSNFTEFFEPAFARELGSIACVPATSYPSYDVGLMRFDQVVVPKDHNLAFTKKPMIDDDVCPPQVGWGWGGGKRAASAKELGARESSVVKEQAWAWGSTSGEAGECEGSA
jgi:hypothetical protein